VDVNNTSSDKSIHKKVLNTTDLTRVKRNHFFLNNATCKATNWSSRGNLSSKTVSRQDVKDTRSNKTKSDWEDNEDQHPNNRWVIGPKAWIITDSRYPHLVQSITSPLIIHEHNGTSWVNTVDVLPRQNASHYHENSAEETTMSPIFKLCLCKE